MHCKAAELIRGLYKTSNSHSHTKELIFTNYKLFGHTVYLPIIIGILFRR